MSAAAAIEQLAGIADQKSAADSVSAMQAAAGKELAARAGLLDEALGSATSTVTSAAKGLGVRAEFVKSKCPVAHSVQRMKWESVAK